MARLSFKPNCSFSRKIVVGAAGARAVCDELASYYHNVLDTIENPTFVVRGNRGTLKAARNMSRRKWLVVVYREVSADDGFMITA